MKNSLKLACAAALAATAAFAPAANAGYTTTKYPIVLVHGIFGFKNFLGADYFYQVPGTITAEGGKVYIPAVSAGNSNEVRGEQLLNQLLTFKALSGSPKFNLIGHSQGSPTSRYVAAVRPDLVASVTSVDGVNKGSRVADIVRKVAPAGTVTEAIGAAVANAFSTMLSFATGSTSLGQDTLAALDSLTTAGLTKFNSKYPAGVPSGCGEGAYTVNGIRYYSWGGAKQLTNVLDPLDLVSPRRGERETASPERMGYGGGRYLGLPALALGLLALWRAPRQATLWVVLALLGALLAMGSYLVVNGEVVELAGGSRVRLPFFFLNRALGYVAEPLNFPVRALAITMTALAVCAALVARAGSPRLALGLAVLAGLDVQVNQLTPWPMQRFAPTAFPGLAALADGPTAPTADLSIIFRPDKESRWAALSAQMTHGQPIQAVPLERL